MPIDNQQYDSRAMVPLRRLLQIDDLGDPPEHVLDIYKMAQDYYRNIVNSRVPSEVLVMCIVLAECLKKMGYFKQQGVPDTDGKTPPFGSIVTIAGKGLKGRSSGIFMGKDKTTGRYKVEMPDGTVMLRTKHQVHFGELSEMAAEKK